jgi:hypothetical protein
LDKLADNDQLIRRYLLGAVSREEAERLDELSFTDDEFAAALQAVENDLVDAFARGELAGQDLELFTSFYLASPRRREKARFAWAFQKVAGSSVATEQPEKPEPVALKRSAADRTGSRREERPRLFFMPWRAWQWGLAAAAALLLIAGGWLMFENRRLQREMDQAQAERREVERRAHELQTELAGVRSSTSEREKELADLREQVARLEQRAPQSSPSPAPSLPERLNIIPFVMQPQTRDISQLPAISIPPDADYIVIQLELESDEYRAYHATLKALPDSRVVWRSGRLRAQARGQGTSVIVSLRPGLLRSPRYILEVSGITTAGAAELVGSYPFRVVKQ